MEVLLPLRLQVNLLPNQIISLRTTFIGRLLETFRDNIWGVDLADMQSVSKCNKGIKYLLCAIDLFSKYVWVVPLKDKRGIRIVN